MVAVLIVASAGGLHSNCDFPDWLGVSVPPLLPDPLIVGAVLTQWKFMKVNGRPREVSWDTMMLNAL